MATPLYGEAAQQGAYQEQGFYRFLSNGGCPAGTTDTDKFHVQHRWIFWIGFGLLFAPGVAYVFMGFQKVRNARHPNIAAVINLIGYDAAEVRWNDVQQARVIAGMVCIIASLAYLTMATSGGFWTKCDGRDFYYARYVDWIITTPLLLYDITRLVGTSTLNSWFIVSLDVLMILAGLVGAVNEHGQDKWAFFAFSMLAFIGIVLALRSMKVFASSDLEIVFTRARNLTLATWMGYPVIWILAEGTGTISVFAESVAYTVLDVIAKTVIGWLIVSATWGFSTSLTVSNSGFSQLDGVYNMTAKMSFGKPEWKGPSNQKIRWRDYPQNGLVWEMALADVTLYNSRDTIDPPTSGWFEGGDGQDAPIRERQIITYNN